MDAFIQAPRAGEVYNLGGGVENNASVLECFALVEELSGVRPQWDYSETNRRGDHICYISDLRKLKRDFPGWGLTRFLRDIVAEMIEAHRNAD